MKKKRQLTCAHEFTIMHGTGGRVGTPIWKCPKCKKKVQST